MTDSSRLLKCDFHLHTSYSDNKEKMSVEDFRNLAIKYNIDVIGMGDHHHNLTQEKWDNQKKDIDSLQSQEPLIMQGFEITFLDGHMLLTGKEEFDGEYVNDAIKQMHSPSNIRIIAHPDNNVCKWKMNLVPEIQGVEIINGGQDNHSFSEDSPCNGLKTYKNYLLMRHKIAPMGNSDCHESAFFGKVWTGIWHSNEEKPTAGSIIKAIRSGNTFASFGNLVIKLYSDTGIIMGNEIQAGEAKEICWKVPEGSETILYYGDMPIDAFNTSDASYVPKYNGPYWILVKKGNTWGATAPLWVHGIKEDVHNIQLKKQEFISNGLIDKLGTRVQKLLDIITNISEKYASDKDLALAYSKWISCFLPNQLNDEELANKSMDMLLTENVKRLELCIKILERSIHDLLQTAASRVNFDEFSNILVHNFDSKPLEPILKVEIYLPPHFDHFYLTTPDVQDISFTAIQMPLGYQEINENRSSERMEEVVIWLARGEIHEYYIHHANIREENETLYVDIGLLPPIFTGGNKTWNTQALLLQEAISQKRYTNFHLKAYSLKKYLFVIDTTLLPIKECSRIIIKEGIGQLSKVDMLRCLYSNLIFTEKRSETFFAVQNSRF